jgi:cell division septal protein FtsQ
VLILLVLLALAGYGLLKAFEINTVAVNSPGRGEEIQAEAHKLIAGSWQQSNLITLSDDQLTSKLQLEDPMLRSVEVRRHWFHTVILTVALKQPSLGWSSDNQRYLLDRDGTAIGMLPAGSALPVVNDGSNLPVKTGSRVTSSRFVAFVGALMPGLAAAGITPTSLDVKDTTLDLSVTTNRGYRIIFDTGRTVEEEMADLKAVQTLLTAQKKAPAEYIDLRVSGKAYYK